MFTYIKIKVPNYYVELEDKLEEQYYNNLGTTWEDFLNNKWVLLNDEQVNFKKENPSASVKEVWNMKINEDNQDKE